MARVSNTLIGKSYGKVGNAVFSVWKGINVLKEKGIPTNPQTDAQMAQRAIFAIFVALYRNAAAVFKLGFVEKAIKMSEFNAFIRRQFENGAYTGTFPSFVPYYPNVQAAEGSLWPTPMTAQVADISEGNIAVTYSTGIVDNQASVDAFCAVAYNEDRDSWAGTIGDSNRAVGAGACTLPAGSQAGDTIHFWTFFYQPSSQIASDSTYTALTAQA